MVVPAATSPLGASLIRESIGFREPHYMWPASDTDSEKRSPSYKNTWDALQSSALSYDNTSVASDYHRSAPIYKAVGRSEVLV